MEHIDSFTLGRILGYDYHKRNRLVSRAWRNWIDGFPPFGQPGAASPVLFTHHSDQVDWQCISQYSVLSCDFMSRFAPQLDWRLVCQYQMLSESLMTQFASQLDWFWVSIRQGMSFDFMVKHADRLDWDLLLSLGRITREFADMYGPGDGDHAAIPEMGRLTFQQMARQATIPEIVWWSFRHMAA